MNAKIAEIVASKEERRRRVLVKFDDGTTVKIVGCWDSFEQYGAPTDYLYASLPVALAYKKFLNGGPNLSDSNKDALIKKANEKIVYEQ